MAIPKDNGVKTSRDFSPSENLSGTGALHIQVWPYHPTHGIQIEMWTDRGKSCVLHGEDARDFINWVSEFKET